MIDPIDLAAMRDRQTFGDGVGDSLGTWAAVCNKDRGELLALVEHLRELAEIKPNRKNSLTISAHGWRDLLARLAEWREAG